MPSNRRGARSGPENHNWRGGRSVASTGYVLIRVGVGHPLADVRGYAYEHRVVMTEQLGRELSPREHVHHKNGDKLDNRPENLEVLTAWQHQAEHRRKIRAFPLQAPETLNPVVACACGCGAMFRQFDSMHRPRRFISGHNIHPKGT